MIINYFYFTYEILIDNL